MTATLEQAYQHCLELAQRHYENFPVASRLLPRRLRKPIAVIYAFARNADDFADEGNLTAEIRLALLDTYADRLHTLEDGRPSDDPVFLALADVIHGHALPYDLFHDLLSAFRQDVTKKRYATYAEVMDYCRRSANPIGRLLLHLSDAATPEHLQQSDAICSALQLINFWQDITQDYDENDRIYLPQDEMAHYGVTETHVRTHSTDAAIRALMDFQIERSRALLLSGMPLGRALGGRLGLELRLTMQSGLWVLDALASNRSDVYARPRLHPQHWPGLLWRALVK